MSELMNEVTKNGTFLDVDEHGNLISDAAFDKIVSPWREAVDYARQLEIQRLGDRLHSLYLRGSVPRGAALLDRSDLDLFAVLFDNESAPPTAPPEFDGFLKDRQIYDHAYDVEDLEQDRETMRQLQAKGLLRA